MRVTLAYPSERGEPPPVEDVLLVDAPDVGDFIRMGSGPKAKTMVVESVTWVASTEDPPKPTVIVAVRARK